MEREPSTKLLHDFAPRLRVYKDGRIERLLKDDTVSAGLDSKTRVQSKDVTVSAAASAAVSARIYLPPVEKLPENTKIPLLIYFHGGAFCLYSASSSIYHRYLNDLVSESNVIAVSVDYRIAPEHPMPACYDDAWETAHWAVSGPGSDPWLARWADLRRVYLAGDSAGANIVHDVVARAGPDGLLSPGVRITGTAMVHPFFGDDEPNGLWDYLYPGTTGIYDPRLNPAADPARMRRELRGCGRVLVCVGGKDFLRDRGVKYYGVLREGGDSDGDCWEGELEFMESKGRGHVFHLYKPDCDEATALLKRVASFISTN